MSSPNKNDTSKLNDGDEVNDMLQNMTTADEEETNTCANCGKEGSDVNNTCNKCNSVMYCNAACKKKHRHKHKKQCEEHLRLAAERAAELHDETLFKQPPAKEDCPICFLRIPSLPSGSIYMSCCGKTVCSGCVYAPVYDHEGNVVADTCPFCRSLYSKSGEETMKRMKKLVEAGNTKAMCNMGDLYHQGRYGLQQDYKKALECWHKAGELGNAESYSNIGCFYYTGKGVEIDKKKATHYFELAAMRGNVMARHNLGNNEWHLGNMDRALKHYMIAVKDGYDSLENIKRMHTDGHASKQDYTTALRAYQAYLAEIKSDQRDKAAAVGDKYKYY